MERSADPSSVEIDLVEIDLICVLVMVDASENSVRQCRAGVGHDEFGRLLLTANRSFSRRSYDLLQTCGALTEKISDLDDSVCAAANTPSARTPPSTTKTPSLSPWRLVPAVMMVR